MKTLCETYFSDSAPDFMTNSLRAASLTLIPPACFNCLVKMTSCSCWMIDACLSCEDIQLTSERTHTHTHTGPGLFNGVLFLSFFLCVEINSELYCRFEVLVLKTWVFPFKVTKLLLHYTSEINIVLPTSPHFCDSYSQVSSQLQN